MERYFLDVFDGHEVVRDEEGQDVANLAAVSVEAEEAAREMLASVLARHEPIDGREIRVRDTSGATVCVVHFRDLID